MKHYLVLLAFVALLAGCGGPASPTPDAVATQVAQAQAVVATLTALAPPATPTSTATSTSTSTPTNTPTNTSTITPTPGPTNTPRPTYTPKPSPTPQLGTERNPLPLGQTGEFDVKYVNTPLKVSFVVTKVIRGDEALKLVQKIDPYYLDLNPQEEFAMAYVEMDYIAGPQNTMQDFWGLLDFAMKTKDGTLLQEDSMTGKEEFKGEGYPPLHVEGWTRFRIRKGSELPLLAYWPRLWFSVQSGLPTPMVYFSLVE